jgi:glycerol-3-phosphate O-acyltransferase 3/4
VWISKAWALAVLARIRHHGRKPALKEPHIFVSNHTTFLDYVLLSSHLIPHAIVAQAHGGFFGYIQRYILVQMGSLTFERSEKRDREKLTRKLKNHVRTHYHIAPILIFPEGTCVNNEYTVLFHKGAFELGVPVCPVAIKSVVSPCLHRRCTSLFFVDTTRSIMIPIGTPENRVFFNTLAT